MNVIKFIKCSWGFIILVVLCVFAAGYFGKNPYEYNAACQVLISLFISLFSGIAGMTYDNKEANEKIDQEKKKAQVEATEKWMPMAKGCISKLLTMQQQVEDIKDVSMKAFTDIDKSNNIDCIKTLANTEVRNREASYKSIDEQLDDAIEDWRRFVMANCQGSECSEVDDLIKIKRNKS